jgi:HK97 gp10 family phage protein
MPRHSHVEIVENQIPALVLAVEAGSKRAATKVAASMEKDAKSRLQPGSFGYDTGAARDSIQGRADGKTVELSGGGDAAPYFPYNEFGTRHRAAAPALVPAFEKGKREFTSDIGHVVSRFR